MKERSTTYVSRLGLLVLGLLCGCGNGGIDPGELVRSGGGSEGPQVLPIFADDTDFERLEEPRPGDWRLGPGRDERPQSFPDYAASHPVRASTQWQRIVLQPLGHFEPGDQELLESLREFTSLFFVCPVDLAEVVPLPASRRRKRMRNQGAFKREWVQHHTKTIMEEVLSPGLPADAICLLGILREDLYPDPDWNYVFGQAYLHRRIGVFSLARYFAAFWQMPTTPSTRKRALRRSLRVLAHEIGHMLSMEHCLHYQCLLNGSNSLAESDRQPPWLGPVCASKLIWNRGVDALDRYRGLERFYRKRSIEREASWYAQRVKRLEGQAGD